MREGWKYCKLGDVCVIERGGSPRPIDNYITDSADGLNWIKIGDATDGSKYITHTKEKIRKEGLKNTRFVHKGDFILSNSMSFGKPYILDIDGCIHDGWLVIHDEANAFNKSFLYYILSSPTMYREFKRLAVGGVVNNLNSQIVRDVVVAIPPLPEQERIVAELDLLTGIFDKQKQQLQELDTLAQSIFYDMFGDPVQNEKGWDTKIISEVCLPKKHIQRASKSFKPSDAIRYVDISSIDNINNVMTSTTQYVFSEAPSRAQQVVHKNDILISLVRPNLNNVAMVSIGGSDLVASSGFCVLRVSDIETKDFLFFSVKMKCFVEYLMQRVSGANYPAVREDDIFGYRIIFPPKQMQQSFAQKIQSIESQKASINQSIAETQKLFDYTMDKYFG